MGRPRTRLPWQYDEARQEFVTAAGIVTLSELAELRYGCANSRIDLAGPWTGWRIRGNKLKPPHAGFVITTSSALQFARWLRDCEIRDARACELAASPPRLYVVR